MTCNNITVTKDDTILEVTSNENVIKLSTDEVIDLEVESQVEIIELKEDFSNVIEVINVNTSSIGLPENYKTFTPTLNQTVFTLDTIPNAAQILLSKVFVNGQKIENVTCYTISGSQLTVILPYSLNSGDLLEIYY